jgi:Domain of unknown function (DUF4345)
MRRALIAVLTLGGIAAVLIGLTHIALGPSSIPGSVPVNATMDSEDRFYATLFVGYGIAMLWCVRAIDRRALCIRFLAGLLFASGISRVVSMVAVGPPNLLFQVLTGVEFVVPVLVWWLLRGVVRAS